MSHYLSRLTAEVGKRIIPSGTAVHTGSRENTKMAISETGLILLFAAGLAGLVVILATPDPLIPDEDTLAEVSQLEELTNVCGSLIYGSLPRESFIGDTTILTMDLDRSLYTPVQANLYLTRALRDAGIEHLTTVERAEGGLTFLALLDNGQPLRLELKY
jgi:hypothetical protein